MRWQKEKDPLSPWRATGERAPASPLSLFGLLALFLTVISFFIWTEERGTGEISQAVSVFEDFFDDNQAIAVFLGWEGE